ncbi:hypothetical protein [Nostoc sp. UHCC 0251]|uniref:hypothetical protein n=1 Tax=Nostoc sp. UHCC 0251 TaxID=3110240 RepID=UPI002B20BAFB|nr:hypothetical protein [Nostoc sp. UHCC 0251]MEA5626523.1 hypothetical protein [Nostoc sp. UHCC 0251]
MSVSPRYWKIWLINPASERVSYKQVLAPLAKEFIQKQLSESQNNDPQSSLISYFYAKQTAVDIRSRAEAGLCLRCYVSEPILKACRKLDTLFGVQKDFSYQDLLTFALNDDGETLVILDSDRKTQLILDDKGKAKTTAYQFFTVKVLQTFNADSQSRMSLDNWAYLQTKQNPEIKNFLSEFGFKHLSDWALLNRARPKQIEGLAERDRHLVEVYHAVYRRDRVQHRQLGAKRCPDPDALQLQEMLTCLQARNVTIKTTTELLKELKQVAVQLRQYDIWSNREPLEISDPDTGNYTTRTDLPYESRDELDVEQQEFLDFLHEQLRIALTQTIEQEIRSCISKLEKSKKYAPFAKQFIPGLQLYYNQGLSLKDIAPRLGMTSWDQARRILNPGELLNKVRVSCVQQLLASILKKAQEKGLTEIPPKSDYLQSLAEQIEAFADAEIFQEAGEEIRAGKNRKMESLYAQQLCLTLNNIT